MRTQRITVGQLALVTDEKERIYLKSLIDHHSDTLVEVTKHVRAFPGVMNMEIYSLAYVEDKGFVVEVGIPRQVVEAIRDATE